MTASGRFPGLNAFLIACEADRREREYEEDVDLLFPARPGRRPSRDIVEVDCKIAEVEPADTHGSKHILLQVELTGVIEADADVDADVRGHLASHAHVLVAIQYNGRGPGIAGSIPGLVAGVEIRVRGAWIPVKQSRPTGGEKLAVLHFTHAPIGFVVVDGTTYR
jgi:endonuclease G